MKLRFLNAASCASPGAQLAEFGVPILGDEGHAEEFETGAPSGFHVNVPFPAGTTVVQLRIGADVKYCRAARPGDVPDVTNVTPGTSPDEGRCCVRSPSAAVRRTQVNGRAIAFDGRDLWATFGPNSSNAMDGKLYKVTTTGTLLRTDNISTPLGALAYDADRGGSTAGTTTWRTANRSSPATSTRSPRARSRPSRALPLPVHERHDLRRGDPKAINGLEDLEGGFVLSADLAKQAFITTRLGADVSSFSTVAAGADCNSGIARDTEGLWLASLATSDSTTFDAHVEDRCPRRGDVHGSRLQGAGHRVRRRHFRAEVRPLDQPGDQHRAAGRAYQVPCAIGATFKFSANAPDIVGTAYFTCGRPGDPLYPIASSLRDTDLTDAISTFTFTFYEQLSCGEGTPNILVTASNGIYESRLPTSAPPFPSLRPRSRRPRRSSRRSTVRPSASYDDPLLRHGAGS